MQKTQGIRPAHMTAKSIFDRYTSRSKRTPQPQPQYDSSADTSPSHSLSHNHSSSEASPPSAQTSHTSLETSWLHDESGQISNQNHNRDSAITLDDSCQYDADDWFAQFRGDLDISDAPPTPAALASAGEIPVYDSVGNSRLFKSLFSVGEVVGDRQLIIFIRHFFCGACQAYVKAITKSINMQTYFTMAIPTSIIVIGCGSPELIRQYKANTQCPFPIFADPTRALFKHLGMGITLDMLGRKRPEYMKDTNALKWLHGQNKEILATKGRKKFRGGNLLQIGGEFLFQEGEVHWCHRMKNMRGHAEVDVIRRVLGIEPSPAT